MPEERIGGSKVRLAPLWVGGRKIRDVCSVVAIMRPGILGAVARVESREEVAGAGRPVEVTGWRERMGEGGVREVVLMGVMV